jgi:hypothetical protein
MDRFTAKYADRLAGTLSGFDRLVFRGTLRRLTYPEGLHGYLNHRGILLKDFGSFAEALTHQLREAGEQAARQAGIPYHYLPTPDLSKEEFARRVAAERGVTDGPICLLGCVEPFRGYELHRNATTKRLQVVRRFGKGMHLYWYEFHPQCGFLHVRLRTWLPFDLQVCMNGREWLARQLQREGIGYERRDNCFTALEDYDRAQTLFATQLQTHWPTLLGEIATRVQPRFAELLGEFCDPYYWTTHQSEWATDLVFKDPEGLRRLYPLLAQHAIRNLGCADVLRFLGRKVPGEVVPACFRSAEVTSDLKHRQEGLRVKHQVNWNSVKSYDKAYTESAAVLRVETTLCRVKELKVYRPKEGGAEEDLEWRRMRKGTADLYRRGELSQKANERYLEALTSVDDAATLAERVERVTQPTEWRGKRVRALRPLEAEDMALLAAVSRGEFAVHGLRNRDLRELLYGADTDAPPEEGRRRAARVTRKLRLLRAHHLVEKVAKTHRYQVTPAGREIMTALLTASGTSVMQLAQAA